MSSEYAETRIKEALKLAKGNRVKARQQIIAWTYEDNRLLHDLARPHLSGIVAYNVERVDSGRADIQRAAADEIPKPKASRGKQPVKKKSMAEKLPPGADQFGLNLLKAATGDHASVFGLEDTGAPRKKQGVSNRHVEAINKLASSKKKPS